MLTKCYLSVDFNQWFQIIFEWVWYLFELVANLDYLVWFVDELNCKFWILYLVCLSVWWTCELDCSSWILLLCFWICNFECVVHEVWLFWSVNIWKPVDVEFLCLNYSQDMNDCAVYAAYSPGITTLAQPVCAGFPSIWGKRRLLSVCIVVVEAVRVEIDCYFMWAFLFYATTFLLIWSPVVAFVVVTNVVFHVEKDTRTANWRRMRLLLY